MTRLMKTGVTVKMNGNNFSLQQLFEKQIDFQAILLQQMENKQRESPLDEDSKSKDLPIDSVEWFKYHCLAMLEEMGEVMTSDKRWKTHRNTKYDLVEKKKELADVFITWCNMVMFSGISADEIVAVILDKINENTKKLTKSQ